MLMEKDKIISYKLDAFEGPLDLLLHLIEKNKINIYDIPIAEITEQYLEYVNHLEEEDLEIVSDFLIMAVSLLEIKAKMLLPKEEGEEEEVDPREELVERLLEYKKYKKMSKLLSKKEESAPLSIRKEASVPEEVERYSPPLDLGALLRGIDLLRLRETMKEILRRKEDRKDTLRSNFGKIKREKISLEGKIRDVLAYARKHGRFSFRQMLKNAKGRSETVVSFLAVLELMKMGKICLTQEKAFSDLDIEVLSEKDGKENEGLDLTDIEEFD